MNAAIANKLNVLESAIIRVEEWANVLFVVVKGLGARFVSKKVLEEKKMTSADCMTIQYSLTEIIVKHYNSGAWIKVDVTTHEITGEFRGTERQVQEEHRLYAVAQSKIKPEPRVSAPAKAKQVKKTATRSGVCLNCDSTGLLLGRGYCTDCYGEC